MTPVDNFETLKLSPCLALNFGKSQSFDCVPSLLPKLFAKKPRGWLKTPLNMNFNGHRSDVSVTPKACELAQHFHGSHECDIEKDLKVYVLQNNVIGFSEKKEFYEDRWMT